MIHALLLAITVTNLTWHDAARDRDIPARIYAPVGVTKAPLIIFSHGLGGTREGYSFFGQHWASNGYICVHLQHAGSDDSAWRGRSDKVASMRGAASGENARHRPLDVSFAITQMLREWHGLPARESDSRAGETHGLEAHATPLINTNAIGVAGHSFGAHTTLAAAGMKLGLKSYGDPRIRAAIPMSSPRPLPATSVCDIKIPCLHLTGTKDDSRIFNTTAADRRVAFDHIPGPGQWLVTFTGATHMTFSGHGDARHLELIRQITTRFWDAHLKQDPAAKTWLAEHGMEKTVGSAGVVEQK